ncbi:ABC transporter ATP-binding protein [Streptomyces sp. RB110-1]|uniref:ABC transporter ATP-binding protein n=1 Tax=unclassified Streptomyces TaxID=2593676 RepID=UPI001902A018|nr:MULTISPECIES: ABC transporter ATP-binding protein [unclassified Streptomyces]MBK0376390.1 ABC transporter ATP-binding protein [Streptomyces sp. RB110-1]MBK0387236.1 ABC transporter ATP-binding protein [Streptomyces sp. RB110-2]
MTRTPPPDDGLRVENLSYRVDDRILLANVDLTVEPGESVAITGPSGSGKSTLLMCVLGLVKPDSGTITAGGHRITGLSSGALAKARRQYLGMVFQFGELLPELTPVENVALPMLLDGSDHRRAYESAAQLLDELEVPHGSTPTGLLSGGERQRTAVARALIAQPSVLLADEPTGALDPRAREKVADQLFRICRERHCALLVVTHDPAIAARASRAFELQNSGLIPTRQGTPA